MSQQMPSNFDFETAFNAIEPLGGGGTFFSKMNVVYGFKVYTQGAENQERSFYPCNMADPESIEKAKAAATKFQGEMGVRIRPALCVQLTFYKNSILGKDAGKWKSDQRKTLNRWTGTDIKTKKNITLLDNVWLPRAKELGCQFPGDYYVKVGFTPDPTGRKEKETDENPVLLWLPVELYKTEEEMRAAAESTGTASSAPAEVLPRGYTDPKVWAQYKPSVLADLAAKPIAVVAKDWDMEVEFLQALAAANGIVK
jgi:hypothetical protein